MPSEAEVFDFLKELKFKRRKIKLEALITKSRKLKDLKLPAATAVIIRGDIDSKKKLDIEKLDSQKKTLLYAVEKGWKVILIGHRNRPTEKEQTAFFSGAPLDDVFCFKPAVLGYLSGMIGKKIGYVRNWLNQDATAVSSEAAEYVKNMGNGDIVLFENERFWEDLWNSLWKANEAELKQLCKKYVMLGREVSEKLSSTLINNAASDAKNVNFSTCALTMFMKNVAMGEQFESEMNKIKIARKAKLVSFSGTKLEKAEQLLCVVQRGYIREIIVGGLLSLIFVKSKSILDGHAISIGKVESKEQIDLNREWYVDEKMIETGKKIWKEAQKNKIKIHCPVDFKLENGEIVDADSIPTDKYAYDIGPRTIEQNKKIIMDYYNRHKNDGEKPTVFHNGTFGYFEKPEFAKGTEEYGKLLKFLHDNGFKIVVGGGEGRQVIKEAEVLIGGGTSILGMSNEPLPALEALWMRSAKKPKPAK
jgi:3-phosphoglycerate kinase